MAKVIVVRHRSVQLVGLILLYAVVACVLSTPVVEAQLPTLPPELEKVRAALDKYQDPYVAVHDGYRSTVGCVEYPKAGGPGRSHIRPVGWACTSAT